MGLINPYSDFYHLQLCSNKAWAHLYIFDKSVKPVTSNSSLQQK